MIRFAENLNKMITAGLGGAMEAPRTEVAVGHRVRYMEASGAVASFESNGIGPVKNLRVSMEPIQAGSGDPSPDNIRPISGRESVSVWREASYDTSADPALTVQLGQTVYGGTVDVTTGMMTVDRAMVDLGTLTWVSENRYMSGLARVDPSATAALGAVYNQIPLCSKVKGVRPKSYIEFEINEIAFTNGDNSAILRIRMEELSGLTNAQIKAALSGVQFCYKLADPLEITLDPASLSTLKGQNKVWSDAGDISLKYPYYEEMEGY